MKISAPILGTLAYLSYCFSLSAVDNEAEKVTYEDHILPILENKCLNCHNPDEAKGGLDLSTYGALLAGGSGGDVVIPEDPNSSRLFTLMAHSEEPYMPPRKAKAPDTELALITKWINGGILETSSSKARKSDRPKMDLTLITTTGKPEGPAAMPEHVILQPEIVTTRPTAVPALAHSPWAPIVAIAGQKQVILYHSQDFDVLGILPYPEGFPQSLSFSSSGALLQAGGGRGGKSGGVVVWDVKSGERIIEVGREFDIVLGSDISPDHRRVVMGGPGKIFKIWDTVSGEQVAAIKKHPDWLLTADYSPDGVLLATGGRNSGLYIWEAESGLEFYTLKGHSLAVTNVAWRPDSNILASISEDGQVMLWEMNEGKQVKKWNAHPGGGLAISFSPDGQMIATAGRDKTVKLWKSDGAAIRTIKASDDMVMSVVFSNDNKRVISGDYNGIIKVWNTDNGSELALLDANPPTIDKQIEYARKRISEINSKIPSLKKTITESKEKSDAAKAKLTEISKNVSKLNGQKSSITKVVSTLSNRAKSLSNQKAKAKGTFSQNSSLMEQRTAERITAEQHYLKAKKAIESQQATLAKQAETLKAAYTALDKTHNAAHQSAFDDPDKEKAFRTARVAVTAGLTAKQIADKKVADKEKEVAPLITKILLLKKALTKATISHNQATAKKNSLQILANSLVNKHIELKEAAPSASQTEATQKIAAELKTAQTSLTAATLQTDKTTTALELQQRKLDEAVALLKRPNEQLAIARNERDVKTKVWQNAQASLNKYLAVKSDRIASITSAQSILSSLTAAHKKAVSDWNVQEKLAKELANKFAQADARLKSAVASETSARAGVEDANATLLAKGKELQQNSIKLSSNRAELENLTKQLDKVAKQKEAQVKTVKAISVAEAAAKKGIEVAKTDLEQSKFLEKKFTAAAINYKAKVESEQLDDMSVELDGMLDQENEAKQEHKIAISSRVKAEKTLENAKKTVELGSKKLKDSTSTVLDQTLNLIASRAAADIVAEASDNEISPVDNEPKFDGAAVLTSIISEAPATVTLPEEFQEEVEVTEVISTTLAVKTPEQIKAEIDALEKRLEDLTSSIELAYTEAGQTRKTVVKATDVVTKTPSLIAQRSKIEQVKAKSAKQIEAERKAQEDTVKKQKALIAQLRKKYLESLPERK